MEQWKDIQGYEGIYQVSSLGRVKSLDRIDRGGKRLNLKFLSTRGTSNGYCQVNLYKENAIKNIAVHQLVAVAFIDNPLNLTQINHKDENKSNNCVENLEWCTHKYNSNYGSCIERSSKKHKKSVSVFTPDMKLYKIFDSVQEASNSLNCDATSIIRCCKGKRRSSGGYIFRYLQEE